jgi:hypothetical protein
MKSSNDTIRNRSRDLAVCSAVPQPLRHRLPPYSVGTGIISREYSGQSVSQTTLLHQALRLRMGAALLLIPIHAIMAWREKTEHLLNHIQ